MALHRSKNYIIFNSYFNMTPPFYTVNLFELNLIEIYDFSYYVTPFISAKNSHITMWVIDNLNLYKTLIKDMNFPQLESLIIIINKNNSINILGKHAQNHP